MKKEFRMSSMVVNQIDKNGNVFTEEALRNCLHSFTGARIGYNFNPNIPGMGKVEKISLKNGMVIIQGYLEIDEPFNESLAIVPSFISKKMHTEMGIRYIDDVELIEFSLTTQPADEDVDRIDL